MKNLISRAPRFFPVLLAVGILATAAPTFAQPGGGPGMNDNPPNMDAGGRGGRGGNRGQNGQNGNRGGDRAQMQTRMITRSLESAGITDQATIEAVTTYATNRQAARKPFYDAANALSEALSDENTTDAQIATLWDDFNVALATEKARTTIAEAELDKQIGYTKNPKLAASLTLLGITGDAMGYLNAGQGGRGGMGGGPGGMGGRGGGQGGPGGMGGGPGGMGGGPGGMGGGPDDNN